MRLGLALLALVACRRIDPGPIDAEPLAPAQAVFDDEVYSILAAKCGATACHGDASFDRVPSKFVSADARLGWFTASRFVALTGPFMAGQAPVLKRIANGHEGVAYTPEEIAAIEHWLAVELSIRTSLPVEVVTGLSTLAADALARFRGCMTFDDFDAAGMAAWGNVQTFDNQRCASCHATGGGGFVAIGVPLELYGAIDRSESRFLQYLTPRVLAPDQVVVGMNFDGFTLVGTGDDPHRTHPRFDAFANAGFAALQRFDEATRLRAERGECGPPAPFPAAKAPEP